MEKAIKFSIENKQFVRALKTATKVINRKNALLDIPVSDYGDYFIYCWT